MGSQQVKHSETFPAIPATNFHPFPAIRKKSLDKVVTGVVTVSGNFR